MLNSKSDYYGDIRDFHTKFSLAYEGEPRPLPDDLALFRIGFMVEELAEYSQASGFVNIARALNDIHQHVKENSRWMINRLEGGRSNEGQFDALIDLTYVALGTAHYHGFDFDEGWNRVHAANMAKVRVQNITDSKRKSAFDVIKPKTWKAPDLSNLVAKDEAY